MERSTVIRIMGRTMARVLLLLCSLVGLVGTEVDDGADGDGEGGGGGIIIAVTTSAGGSGGGGGGGGGGGDGSGYWSCA